jgi:prevent-host-death family protein
MVMKTVRIAELKARLSSHLRDVRRGRSITVLDRATPIARIVPYRADSEPLTVRRPTAKSRGPAAVKLPPPLKIRQDVVEFLLAERQTER